MIEINLLPGSGNKARKGGAGPKLNIGASLGIRDRVRDPWLAGAISSAVVGLPSSALLDDAGSPRGALDEALQKAVQDSTRYASVLRERETAEAKRDTVVRSLNMHPRDRR